MKKIALVILLCFLSSLINNTQAQVMAKKPEWITIKSVNLRCWTCKSRLEDYLMKESQMNYESGIAELKFNLLAGEIKIKFYPDRINAEDIRQIMNNAGFDADTTKAIESSYKKLPSQCKYTSEGGGPKKGEPCHVEPE